MRALFFIAAALLSMTAGTAPCHIDRAQREERSPDCGLRPPLEMTAISTSLGSTEHRQGFNREPLESSGYAELPLGAIRAEGWLKEQLKRQAEGLSGHMDEVYPEVMGPSNAWRGGDGDAWERGPYWIDGLLPLAWILDDAALKAKAMQWVESMLASQREDGYFGPAQDHPFVYGLQRGKSHDWWPKMVALKILRQYYMASGDERVTECLGKYFRYQLRTLRDYPLDHWSDWGRWRGGDNLDTVLWLYNLSGEEYLLELASLLHSQTVPWTEIFTRGEIFHTWASDIHCVNLAHGFKEPLVWWQYSHSPEDLAAPEKGLEAMRHTAGLPTGLWAGDEKLQWGHPNRGSELCTAVEMMFSLETMLRISGNILWADQLERVAYNALPAQINPDFTAKQYFQQTNQTACTREWRPFSTLHDGTDNMFGLLNGYPCCLSNMHQGWPKLTQNLWYATADGGLAALVYAPSQVTATVAGGVEVRLSESTCYPFRENIDFKIDFVRKKVRKAAFPLHLRIPAWCEGAVIRINGEETQAAAVNGILTLSREWKRGDTVSLELPMKVRSEQWFGGAWTFVRGPLVYALRMKEEWKWADYPEKDRKYGRGAWEVTSPTQWNYCIMRDEFSPEDCRVEKNAWEAYPWTEAAAPVSVFVPARILGHWKEYSGSPGDIAFWTEDGTDAGERVEAELIPYGCTTLRITEFPTRIIPWDVNLK